jgi:hypothetical protein
MEKPPEKKDDGLAIGDLGPDPDNIMLEAGATGIGELGATGGVGLEEIALQEGLELDDMERRELLVNPSDLQDVGDPEAGDVGVVGGLGAGGEMGMGGRDHNPNDPWSSELTDENGSVAGVGGTGAIESEMAEFEEEKAQFEEEKM